MCRLIQVHKSTRVSNKWWKATEESSHVRFVPWASRALELAWKWKTWIRRRKLARWHVWKTAYPSCQPSTICFLYQLPAPVKTLKCTQSPSASLGRVEFFNSHNSVARWLSLSLFSLFYHFSPRTLWCCAKGDTLLAWWKLRAYRKHCIIAWKPRRWHCLVILVATLRRFEYERSDKQRKHYHENNRALIKRLEAAESKIVSDLNNQIIPSTFKRWQIAQRFRRVSLIQPIRNARMSPPSRRR